MENRISIEQLQLLFYSFPLFRPVPSFIAEIFIQLPVTGKVKIPHQEKQVMRTGEDIVDDLVEEFLLVGNQVMGVHGVDSSKHSIDSKMCILKYN